MFETCTREIVRQLSRYTSPITFNPYTQHHSTLDLPDAASIRLDNLTHYLHDHQHARIALIGEATGYAGCRFTGIPFTCEAQLREWNSPRYRASSLRGDHDERSARCVWQALYGGRGVSRSSPQADTSTSCANVIFWNVFPWHPHMPGQPMSNRKPTAAEIRAGIGVLELFLDWLQPERVIAVGRVAEQALRTLNVPATYARHPSHGGQRQFQSAIHSLFNSES